MQRVSPENVSDLLTQDARTVLLFGAPHGESVMAQAVVFAEAWVEHRAEAAFGYVDAAEHVALARSFGVRVLPTTLVLDRSEIVARFEGRCSGAAIASALFAPPDARVAA